MHPERMTILHFPKPARQKEPFLNLPPATESLVLLLVIIHLVRLVLPGSADDWLLQHAALIPALLTQKASFPYSLPTLVTFAFLHGGWTHLIINTVTLAAFGTAMERTLGPRRMLVFFLVTSVIAGLAQVLAEPGAMVLVIGASGGISGMFGGILHLMRGIQGRKRTFDRRLLGLAALFILITLAGGSIGIPGNRGIMVAVMAHVGGFVAGLALFPLMMRR